MILEIAEKESCVIIGRNADFILKDKDNVLNVFIHGDMPEKVARICKLYNVTEEEAEKMMADIDKRRMTNYRFYTDQKWGMAKNYINMITLLLQRFSHRCFESRCCFFLSYNCYNKREI